MIDTFVIFYKTSNYNTKDVLSLTGVIRELTRKDFDGNLRLCVKPSLFIKKYSSTESSNNKVLCNLKEALLVKDYFDKKIGEIGELRRVDFAYDTEIHFNENQKLNKFFISMLLASRNSSLNKIFSTNTNNTSLNMKIKNKTMEFSIYNCNDKDRLGNTRYEQRFTSLRGLDNFQNKILKSLDKYEKELCDLTSTIPVIETYFSELIYNEYQMSKNKYKNLHEFIAKMDASNFILTKNVFKQFFEKISDGNVDFYIKNFRRKRKDALKFITKLEMETLIKKIRIAIDKTK